MNRRGTGVRAAASSKSLTTLFVVVALVSLGVAGWGFVILTAPSTQGSSDTIEFQEFGLPVGTVWGVVLNGITHSSTVRSYTDSVSFGVNQGSYNFTVLQVRNFTAYPASGTITTVDPVMFVNITFSSTLVPIGSAFAVGNPVLGQCSAGDSFAVNGCNAGDYTYTLTIEISSVEFGNVLFTVRTASGSNYTVLPGSGGFSIVAITGEVAAQTNSTQMGNTLWMSTNWLTYGPGYVPSYPLTSIDTILIDMGKANPTGLGLTFVVFGSGNYSGSTPPLALP